MPEKQVYYISLDKRTISKVSVPDTTEYAIVVTENELETITSLLEENDKHDFWFAMKNIPLKPFNEREVDDMRQEDYDNLMKVYQYIYEFGTPETREKLAEVGYDKR